MKKKEINRQKKRSEECNSKETDGESMSEEYEAAEDSTDYQEIQEQQLELRRSTRVKRFPGNMVMLF